MIHPVVVRRGDLHKGLWLWLFGKFDILNGYLCFEQEEET